jgi:hypothetical protein
VKFSYDLRSDHEVTSHKATSQLETVTWPGQERDNLNHARNSMH